MQTRHRVPVVFTLYMVDVFCCALGCVILLWLASARDAQRKAAAHTQTAKRLADAQLGLASAQAELAALRQERAGLVRRAAEADQRHRSARAELAKARALAERLRTELKQARARRAELAAALQFKTKEHEALAGKLGESSANVRVLIERLSKAEARTAELTAQAESLRAEARDHRTRLAALEGRSGSLTKDVRQRDDKLADAERRLAEMDRARVKLQRQLDATRADSERRFAGLALSGRRVVFLVDISGSMRKRDPSTDDPKKWPLVCEALGRLMRSLPDLKQYQVIVFSDEISYPLGRKSYWLDYDPKASAQATVERLKRVVPRGDTNMSAAFAEAFRYRPLEMDTIYLLSDGLPNLGDGLPSRSAGLKDTDKSLHLSRYVRQTLQTWWNRELFGRPRVRINTIGFYFDSPEVGAFLWALARENDGGFVGMSQP